MTIKEIIQSAQSGEIVWGDHPEYFERLIAYLDYLRDLQSSAPQDQMEAYTYEITTLEDLLESSI